MVLNKDNWLYHATFNGTQNSTQSHQAESAYDYIQSLGNNTIQKFGSPTVELYVCHANIIKYIFSRLSDVPLQCLYTYDHCGITYIDVLASGELTVVYYNYSEFLS